MASNNYSVLCVRCVKILYNEDVASAQALRFIRACTDIRDLHTWVTHITPIPWTEVLDVP